MSNIYYLELIARRSDRQRFEDAGLHLKETRKLENSTKPYIYLFNEEANYEDFGKLEDVANIKIPFYGSREYESEYFGELFTSVQGKIQWVFMFNQNILIRIDHKMMKPVKEDLEKVKRYLEMLKLAKELIEKD